MNDLEQRNKELFMLIQLLATYGPSALNEEELLEVCKTYQKLNKKFDAKYSFIVVNNLLLGLGITDTLNKGIKGIPITVMTSFTDGLLVHKYIEYRNSIKKELDIIKKFKKSIIKTPEAYKKLRIQLLEYQQEYEDNSKLVKKQNKIYNLTNKVD